MSSASRHDRVPPLLRRILLSLFLLPPILLLAAFLFSPAAPNPFESFAAEESDIWCARRVVDWYPCDWWKSAPSAALPAKTNGYIRVDCYGGLNQMRRDFCDGIGMARILNAILVLPKFEVAAYWNESRLLYTTNSRFCRSCERIARRICFKRTFQSGLPQRKGQFDYVEAVLPALLEHRYISLTPAMSQRRDRYPLYAKAALCQGCYRALRLSKHLEAKGSELFKLIPQPFLALHLRFEPDMVAYSQCEYSGLSSASMNSIESAHGDRKPWTGDAALAWRNREKCPLTPQETAFILQSLKIPANTAIYLTCNSKTSN